MSRHRLYRNYDYENDLDEYDGEAEEDPEARQLMKDGIKKVQEALGPSADKVTVVQIEEALWHYYYDIDKSVGYLMDKFVTPKPKPKKQTEGKSTVPILVYDLVSSHSSSPLHSVRLQLRPVWFRWSIVHGASAGTPQQWPVCRPGTAR